MKALSLRKNESKGKLITFCGLDGAGKSTMIELLTAYLQSQGKRVFLTKQPTDFVRNSDIFRNFQDSADHTGYDYLSLSLLAAADRVQHTSQVIQPQLDMVDYVISDRYIYSCLANLHARGYQNDSWLYEVSKTIIQPDLAFFINIPVSQAVERVRRRPQEKDRYIDMAFQEKLRNEYFEMAEWDSSCLIDGTMPMRAEYTDMIREIEKLEDVNHE